MKVWALVVLFCVSLSAAAAVELDAIGYRFVVDDMERIRVVADEPVIDNGLWRENLNRDQQTSLESTFKVAKRDGLHGIGLNHRELFGREGRFLSQKGRAVLARLADYLKGIAGGEIVVIGHIDAQSTEAESRRTSLERAWLVVEHLIERHNIPPTVFSMVAAGHAEPIFKETDQNGFDWQQGRVKNRRIEVLFSTARQERVMHRSFNVADTGLVSPRLSKPQQ